MRSTSFSRRPSRRSPPFLPWVRCEMVNGVLVDRVPRHGVQSTTESPGESPRPKGYSQCEGHARAGGDHQLRKIELHGDRLESVGHVAPGATCGAGDGRSRKRLASRAGQDAARPPRSAPRLACQPLRRWLEPRPSVRLRLAQTALHRAHGFQPTSLLALITRRLRVRIWPRYPEKACKAGSSLVASRCGAPLRHLNIVSLCIFL